MLATVTCYTFTAHRQVLIAVRHISILEALEANPGFERSGNTDATVNKADVSQKWQILRQASC